MIDATRNTIVPTSETIATRSDTEQPNREPVQPNLETSVPAEPGVDVAALQQENEKLKKRLGDQGNSVGELRRELAQLQEQMNQPREPLQEVDFYDDPTAAVDRAIEQKMAPLQKQMLEERATQALSAIRAAHGDYDDIVQSEGFRGWMDSSRYRQVLAREAENSLDPQAAIELVNMYKADTDVTPAQAVERDRELRASATESGRGYAGSGARFSWKQLQLLQVRDPQQYKALLPQVMQAHKEGRVDP